MLHSKMPGLQGYVLEDVGDGFTQFCRRLMMPPSKLVMTPQRGIGDTKNEPRQPLRELPAAPKIELNRTVLLIAASSTPNH